MQSIALQDYQHYELIVADNGSVSENLDVIRNLVGKAPKARLIELGENLGVAGGRNVVLTSCSGDLLVELDDDSLLASPLVFSRAVHLMQSDASIGILAFKIRNYWTRKIDRHEYPFLTKKRNPDQDGETTWFIGCGHFFRRELVLQIGGYREFFPYGSEELDYAFRALNAGFRVVYAHELEVLHKKSLKRRIVDPVHFGSLCLKHRLKVATLNLPWIFCFSYLLVRGFQYSGWLRHPSVILRALVMLYADRNYIRNHRKVISVATMKRILELRGPLFF